MRQLYNAEDLDELLNESDQIASRRKETGVLKKAQSVIGEIREAHI